MTSRSVLPPGGHDEKHKRKKTFRQK